MTLQLTLKKSTPEGGSPRLPAYLVVRIAPGSYRIEGFFHRGCPFLVSTATTLYLVRLEFLPGLNFF